jgi:hypothetical protein
MKTRRFLAGLACALCLVLVGCGGDTQLEISSKRIQLDLVFKDGKLSPEAEKILAAPNAPLGLPPSSSFVPFGGAPAPVPLPDNSFDRPGYVPTEADNPYACPAAPPDAPIKLPVSVRPKTTPQPGTYLTRNTGSIKLTGPVSFTLPFPPFLTVTYSSPTTEPSNGFAQAVQLFDVSVPGLAGPTVTTYAFTGAELQLVKKVEHPAKDVPPKVFAPATRITIVKFEGTAATWQSTGTDPNSLTTMIVQGSIIGTEKVDLCGELVDSYRVSSNEQLINPLTGEQSTTDATDPNIYNVATQYGAIFVRQHIHTTNTYKTDDGTPVVLDFNYTQKLDSIEPDPALAR